MRLDELRGFVTSYASPEELALFNEAIDLFEKFELEEYLEQYDILLGNYYDGSEQNAYDAVKATTVAICISIVAQHGIQLVDEVTQRQLNRILDVLIKITDWEDKNTILDICNQDIDVNSKFTLIMDEITGENNDEYMCVFESIDANLFQLIKENITSNEEESFDLDQVEKINAYAKFRAKIKEPNLWADRYINMPGINQTSFTDLLALLCADIKGEIDTASSDKDYKYIALELITLAAVSIEGLANAKKIIYENQDVLYRDTVRAMKLNAAVDSAFMENVDE